MAATPGHDASPILVLGTAQWGSDYGVTNATGRLSDAAIRGIVELLPVVGIGLLDTAPAYGDAEARIGTLAHSLAVQTKVSGAGDVRTSVERSADLLGHAPDRVIVHDWPNLADSRRAEVARELEALRSLGVVGHVGISGYDSADLAGGLSHFERLDVAQLPVSILDQRLAGAPEVVALRSNGGVLQARSVYLQGLALSRPGQSSLAAHPDLVRLRQAAANVGRDVGALCRSYVRAQECIDEVVVGVTSADELLAWSEDDRIELTWSDLASQDDALVDPRRWSLTGRGG